MLMLMLGLKSPPHRGLLKLRPMRTLWPTPPSVNLHPLCTASLLLPSTDFRTSAKICVTYVDSGLQRSERESTVSTQRSLFLIFCLVFVFLRRSGQTWGGGVTWLLFCLVFPGLQGMVQMTMIILIIILIINILIIVTCIHSIFVERQREQVPPTYYNKGPDSTDYQ